MTIKSTAYTLLASAILAACAQKNDDSKTSLSLDDTTSIAQRTGFHFKLVGNSAVLLEKNGGLKNIKGAELTFLLNHPQRDNILRDNIGLAFLRERTDSNTVKQTTYEKDTFTFTENGGEIMVETDSKSPNIKRTNISQDSARKKTIDLIMK